MSENTNIKPPRSDFWSVAIYRKMTKDTFAEVHMLFAAKMDMPHSLLTFSFLSLIHYALAFISQRCLVALVSINLPFIDFSFNYNISPSPISIACI